MGQMLSKESQPAVVAVVDLVDAMGNIDSDWWVGLLHSDWWVGLVHSDWWVVAQGLAGCGAWISLES